MDPKKVLHPRELCIEKILYDSGDEGWSLAELSINGSASFFGIRWNGESERDLGQPISRQYPIWFYLPEDFTPIIQGLIAISKGVTRT